VTEVLAVAEDLNQTTRCAPCNPRAHVTLEVYSFDKEPHEVWEVLCIQPLETEGVIVVAAKVSVNSFSFCQICIYISL
jgi:hypothetical protein